MAQQVPVYFQIIRIDPTGPIDVTVNHDVDISTYERAIAGMEEPREEEQSIPDPLQESKTYDTGLTAWLHVLGAFFLVFNTWGILNAFGAYQTYYSSGALFTASSSQISLIGSLEAFILLFTGCLAGPIFDAGFLRALVALGTSCIVMGHVALSFCHRYWAVLISQGILVGLGTGCLFVPCMAVLPQYFKRRLGLASGIAIGGSSVGGIIYPIVLYRLIEEIGFPWAVRTLGFIALATLLIPIAILRMRDPPKPSRSVIDWTAFKDIDYLLLTFTGFLAYMGLFVLLFYLSFYADNAGLTSSSLAFYLVPIFNAGSCIGRTVPNAVADKTGPLDIIAPGAFIVGLLEFCMIAANNTAGMVALAVVSGIFSGILIGVLPLCFISLTKDKSKLGTRMGMGFAFLGLGVVCAGPDAGGLLGDTNALDWQSAWIFGGVATCASGVGFLILRLKKYGTRSILKA